MDIEGLTIDELKALPSEDLDELVAFGRPITFRMGSATILAEFNIDSDRLLVSLAHIDDGGEGVPVLLWKLIEGLAKEREHRSIQWNVHALTCANPNPRLQAFLRKRGFKEVSNERHGRVLSLEQVL